MSKLTKQQIEKIKALRRKGKSIQKIANQFHVAVFTISWHTNPDFKDKIKEYQRERYRKMTKSQKKEYFGKKRAYQKEYHKRRYNEDEDFRNKHLKLMKVKK